MTTTVKDGRVLRHPSLSHAALVNLLTRQVPEEQTAWYLTTRVTDTCFDVLAKAMATTLVAEWSQGRVFWATCEIRWQRAPGAAQNDVLVLCEDQTLHLEGFQPIGTAWQIVSTGTHARLMAWGSLVSDTSHTRAESRLPKRLHYPNGCQAGEVSLVYYCAPSGEVQFLRLTGVR
jgi:hypothetical protein